MRIFTTRPRRVLVVLPLTLLLLVLAAACVNGGDDDDDADRGPQYEAGGVYSTSLPTTDGESGDTAEDTYDDEGEARAEEAPIAGGSAPYQTAYVAQQMQLDRLIIRTVTLKLTVQDVAQGSIWLRDLAARKSGFVLSSNTYVQDESEFAQITIRVPADQLDSTVQELREHELVVRVDSEESTSQDVSQEFVDNEARLEALEETQRRFLALLSEADNVEEILRIEAELTNIRSQIETIKGRQNYLEQMTAFSTVTVTLTGEFDTIEMVEEDDGEGFLARIFGDSWGSASGVIEDLLRGTITVGIIGLAALPFALVLYFVGRVVYRRAQRALSSARAVPVTVAQPAVEESQ